MADRCLFSWARRCLSFPLIRDYMDIWLLGAFAIVVPQVGNAAIRAAGNAKVPGRVMIGAAALNVMLDPVFMFGWFGLPRMELQGAALASVVSFALSFGVRRFICWPFNCIF